MYFSLSTLDKLLRFVVDGEAAFRSHAKICNHGCPTARSDGGKGDLRFPGIGAVDGFAVVAQGQLRESFRVAGRLRPPRPRVAIRMQGDSPNAKTVAALFELD
jgi:hypothetical protein